MTVFISCAENNNNEPDLKEQDYSEFVSTSGEFYRDYDTSNLIEGRTIF